jgi:hypothetical protein
MGELLQIQIPLRKYNGGMIFSKAAYSQKPERDRMIIDLDIPIAVP